MAVYSDSSSQSSSKSVVVSMDDCSWTDDLALNSCLQSTELVLSRRHLLVILACLYEQELCRVKQVF